MREMWTRKVASVMLSATIIFGAACSSTGDGGENGGDPDDFQQQLEDGFTNNLAGFAESLERFTLAAQGIPQDGVTLTPTETGINGSVGVDVNGDGSLETDVNGSVVFNNPSAGFAEGGTFTLTSIAGGAPQTASGSATITPIGPAAISITNGNFQTHTDTRDNDLSLSAVNINVDASGSEIYAVGTAAFNFNDLVGTLTFMQTTNGYGIQVSGSGFDTFVVD